MKKDVLITIKGLQNYEEQDEDSIELVTHGKFYRKEEDYYIVYKESELTGLGDTTTTVKIEPHRVTVIRSGETRSHMIFEEGEKHISYYDTGVGALTIGVTTRQINKSINDFHATLIIDYIMEINNSAIGENVFNIAVKEV
ncbi:MAG: DUF1934 domain-containing protein [Clostridia bacterium]|nr:DUF1934 domain-containing protein [Clostridia bacterium]